MLLKIIHLINKVRYFTRAARCRIQLRLSHHLRIKNMEGLHLTADCFDCLCDEALLTDQHSLAPLLRQVTVDAGLTIVGERFHAFQHDNGCAAGFTGTLLLAESHVAIHTWPERKAVTLDVYVCNFENDNSAKAENIVDELIKRLQPMRTRRQQLHRGVPNNETSLDFVEHLSPHTSMHTDAAQVLVRVKSAFQEIEIAETPEFGRVMRIDGAMMTSEKDEYLYHEALVHPAAICTGNPKTALIIGGGDGGSTEELLKHATIEHVTLCEIDPEVIEISKRHLEPIHQRAFDDPRVKVLNADGFAFISKTTQRFDLVLLDLTDPIAPNGTQLAAPCMSEEFFESCYRALNDNGAIVLHLGSRFYHTDRYATTLQRLQARFDLVRPYSVFIPLYGALWSMAVAIKQTAPGQVKDPLLASESEIENALSSLQIRNLKYYSPQTHVAMFRI